MWTPGLGERDPSTAFNVQIRTLRPPAEKGQSLHLEGRFHGSNGDGSRGWAAKSNALPVRQSSGSLVEVVICFF
jgi:hypothetical protein